MRNGKRRGREILQELRGETMSRSILFFIFHFSLLIVLAVSGANGQVNMPDPSAIAGQPLPAPELPNATVSVRVVRERMGNNVAGQEVTLNVGTSPRRAKTDAQGRAQFDGIPRSEERRVGKECRSRWAGQHQKRNKM